MNCTGVKKPVSRAIGVNRKWHSPAHNGKSRHKWQKSAEGNETPMESKRKSKDLDIDDKKMEIEQQINMITCYPYRISPGNDHLRAAEESETTWCP